MKIDESLERNYQARSIDQWLYSGISKKEVTNRKNKKLLKKINKRRQNKKSKGIN